MRTGSSKEQSVSSHNRRIKGRGWGRRKRIPGKNEGVVGGGGKGNSLPLSPSSPLNTQARYNVQFSSTVLLAEKELFSTF